MIADRQIGVGQREAAWRLHLYSSTKYRAIDTRVKPAFS